LDALHAGLRLRPRPAARAGRQRRRQLRRQLRRARGPDDLRRDGGRKMGFVSHALVLLLLVLARCLSVWGTKKAHPPGSGAGSCANEKAHSPCLRRWALVDAGGALRALHQLTETFGVSTSLTATHAHHRMGATTRTHSTTGAATGVESRVHPTNARFGFSQKVR